MMISKIQKWGNSQGLRLPKQVLELADLAVGDDVEIAVSNHKIVVKKVVKTKYDLADLVACIPRGYKPEEVGFGAPVGKEVW